jgi:hypothetical protein
MLGQAGVYTSYGNQFLIRAMDLILLPDGFDVSHSAANLSHLSS